MKTYDLGNNESASVGVVQNTDGTWLALTFTQSKEFKTEAGARRWLAARMGK